MFSKYPILFFLLISFIGFGQTKSEIASFTKDYNKTKLNALAGEFQTNFLKEKEIALEYAKLHAIPVSYYDAEGSFLELMKIVENKPIYYKTTNRNAARVSRANFLHAGGALGLDIEGQNMTAYVWDGGIPRLSHVEFEDPDTGDSKISIGDSGSQNHDHATHVMGTFVANGAIANAKGMAPQAVGVAYDWNNDNSEIISAANNGMLVSNHSYGWDATQIPDWYFGAYNYASRAVDQMLYNAPYYMMLVAAGNDGQDNSSNGNPLDGNNMFDKLSGTSTSKNNLVVANSEDIQVINSTTGELVSTVAINNSSSEGPTDDYRIKPDITGNGTSVISSWGTADDDYMAATGTSMSSPSVAGSLLLLQQFHNEETGGYMRAATLKGLALHTATDAGMLGPDAIFGWGILNTKKAVETIQNNGNTTFIEEHTYNDGDVIEYQFVSDGVNPLQISISFIDPPGPTNSGVANNTTPVLVHDLSLRVLQDGTYYHPWKLTGVDTNTQDTNSVDPFKRFDIDNASGTYDVEVTFNGTLIAPQDFTIIATGLEDTGISVSEELLSNYRLFPNPSTDLFNLRFKTNEKNPVLISITDITGKVLKRQEYKNVGNLFQNTLDLSAFSEGIYFLQINHGAIQQFDKLILN